MKNRVVIGMSGGVDSSVAALLLKQQGYEVIAVFMRNWDSLANQDILGNPDLNADICPQEQDYQDAVKVCKHLDIPLYKVDFIEEYWRDVFTYFLSEYEKGRTPNPDILCNKYIKFEAFIDHVSIYKPDYIAMGHYARIDHNHPLKLLRGIDENKDQTYFLSQLNQNQLKKILFPIGNLLKKDVRALAMKYQLPTANKKDSTGICFIGEREFNQFLDNYLPAKPGEIKTITGDTIGKHNGLMHYTIGQRKGLKIGGSETYGNEPWFVIGKDLLTNTLLVGQGFHHEGLYSTSCSIESLNLINPSLIIDGLQLTAKFRYRQKDTNVRIKQDKNIVRVYYDTPVRAVTPGQACVFYDGDICIGGGFIKHVYKNGDKLPY